MVNRSHPFWAGRGRRAISSLALAVLGAFLFLISSAATEDQARVVYAPMVSSFAVSPETVPPFGRLAGVSPYLPPDASAGARAFNLRLPDDFSLPPSELRRIAAAGRSTEDQSLSAPPARPLIQDFPGIDQTSLTPPDCDIAAGPAHLVVVVNASFAVYDKCGTQLLETTFASFLDDPVHFLFDPKVIYDHWDDRWIMNVVARLDGLEECYYVVIVSETGDPTGSWYRYYLDSTMDGDTPTGFWGDFPDLGVCPEAVYITSNQFTFGSRIFQYSKIRILDKQQIYAGAAVTWQDFVGLNNPGDGSPASSLRAAKMHDHPGMYYLVNSKPGGGSILSLWEISNPVNAPSLAGYSVAVDAYDDPPLLQQPDGSLVDGCDARLLSATFRDGRLWTCNGQRKDTGEPVLRSEAHVYQINTAGRSLSWEGGLYQAGYYYAYPAVDVDSTGQGIMAVARGGPTEFIGTRYAEVALGGGISSSSLLVAGQANYAGGGAGSPVSPFRWGDYFGCDLDPFDQRTLWFYGQFASSDPLPSWDTHLGAASYFGPGLMEVIPSLSFSAMGYQGGPFSPPEIDYHIMNTGGSAFTWALAWTAPWNRPDTFTGQVPPGGSQVVTIAIDSTAGSLGPGSYVDNYAFTNCYDSSYAIRSTQLSVIASGTGVAEIPLPELPFSLSPPYPNPVSKSATIWFNLEEPGPVSLSLHDARGRKLADLLREPDHSGGPVRFSFDARRFPSGVYFIRIESSHGTLARKINIVH